MLHLLFTKPSTIAKMSHIEIISGELNEYKTGNDYILAAAKRMKKKATRDKLTSFDPMRRLFYLQTI